MPQQCWKRSPKYQGLESIADKKKSSVHRQDPETFTKEVISSELLSFVQRKHAFEAFEGLRVEGEGEGGRRGGSLQTSKVRTKASKPSSKPSKARSLRGRGRRDFRSLRSLLSKPLKASKGALKPSSSPSKPSKASSKFVFPFLNLFYFSSFSHP